MKKDTLHIIAHTHWDREWYMPFEQHRIRLVHFMDTLIETMESNPDYSYFHLDGQMILIEDYLAVRPTMKNRLQKLIQDNRIIIGPWYVLQDEYLTSGEANIRNLLLGLRMAKEYGSPLKIGYFPDSFGNISQAPQILNGFKIKRAIFGRGLSNLGPDNDVSDGQINDSELYWQSPDGSSVLSVMFANWYHNAMELPLEKDKLNKRLNEIVNNTKRHATTNQLLGMNGCDHQPLQTNLPDVIKQANNIQDGVEVEFSHFDKYFDHLEQQHPTLQTHTGEIAGQYTNGWYLLVSTASTRIHTKQLNYRAQNELTKHTEPLLSFLNLHNEFDYRPLLRHNWKLLMENHPHDTICGCSNDRTHQDMITMLNRSIDLSLGLQNDALSKFIDKKGTTIYVFNPTTKPTAQHIRVSIDFPLDSTLDSNEFTVLDPHGKPIESTWKYLGKQFTYELPDDAFRKPYYVDRFEVTFIADVDSGFGLSKYQLIPSQASETSMFHNDDKTIESKQVKLTVLEDGTIRINDKRTNKEFHGLNLYEDRGDRGNEYEFVETTDKHVITSKKTVTSISHNLDNSLQASITVSQTLDIPEALDKDKRTRETKPLVLETTYTIYDHTNRIDVDCVIHNQHKNHRLRALFPTFEDDITIYAEGQFDLIKRELHPWKGWENPSNLQRFETMVMVENKKQGILIASSGIHEYEVLRNSTHDLAITLLRSVGEIGDWGDFNTPDAQMQGTYTLSYSIIPYQPSNRGNAIHKAYTYAHKPLSVIQADFDNLHPNKIHNLIHVAHPDVYTSTIKPAEESSDIIVRLYHLKESPTSVNIDIASCFTAAYKVNLNEEKQRQLPIRNNRLQIDLKQKEIITISLSTTNN